MWKPRVGSRALVGLLILWALALLPGLGSSSRLTYHEALVAQGAREILATGEWTYPTIGGLPWLEKPPLPWWLVAALGYCRGAVTETVARLPSAIAAGALVIAVATLATRHYGFGIGLLAGAIQTTTAWTVIRGRLAEADVLLACVVTWALVAFDCVRCGSAQVDGDVVSRTVSCRWRWARWAFFALLGSSALVKGIGFGAVLIGLIACIVLAWERDRALLHRLWFPAGWGVASVLAVVWPVAMVARHGPDTIVLWMTHFAGRLLQHQGRGPFASEPWWEFLPSVVAQALPWSPLAVLGACRSLGRAGRACSKASSGGALTSATPGAIDRLLWAWSAGPLILVSAAAVRNAHYAVCAQVPWSIWAALELAHVGNVLVQRGWSRVRLDQIAKCAFTTLALAYGAGFWLLGPRFDRRGVEWAFYESAARQVPSTVPLTLLYDDWDRNAYDGAIGALPHDLAVRLFYLGRAACWHTSPGSLTAHAHAQGLIGYAQGRWPIAGERVAQPLPCNQGHEDDPRARVSPAFVVIGRDRDLPALVQLGHVDVLARGPTLRRDRTYTLFQVTPRRPVLNAPIPIARAATTDRRLDR
jgi:hypothetical protein